MATKRSSDPSKFQGVKPTKKAEAAGKKFEEIRAKQRKKNIEAITKPFKDLFSEIQVEEAFTVAKNDPFSQFEKLRADKKKVLSNRKLREVQDSFNRTNKAVNEWKNNNKKIVNE